MATDVVGHLVEVIDGRPFDVFLREEMFEPLGMPDTGFHLPPEMVPRFAGNYTVTAKRRSVDRMPAPVAISRFQPINQATAVYYRRWTIICAF